MPAVIIAVSDSRGKGLATHLRKKIPPSTKTFVNYQKGARLEDLYATIRTTADRLNRTLPPHETVILLHGGICNLTERTYLKEGQQITFNINKAEQKADQIKTEFRKVANYCRHRGYKLIVATITPADLIKSRDEYIKEKRLSSKAKDKHQELVEQQTVLEETLAKINSHVIENQQELQYSAINIHRDCINRVIKTRGKKGKKRQLKIRKLNSEHLQDGIHADKILNNLIFNKLTAACIRAITPTAVCGIDSQTDSQEEAEADTWSFKRQKSERS